jgi:hypothetical protein
MTVTGRTLGENLERWTHEHGELSNSQDVIRPLENPIKDTGHIRFVSTRRLSSLYSDMKGQSAKRQSGTRGRNSENHWQGGPRFHWKSAYIRL